MAPNVPEVQILFDTGDKTVVKVVGYFTAATNSNTKIVQANTLSYANSSLPCILSATTVQYAAGFANGYCSIQWAAGGAATNNDMLILGGKTSSQFVAYMPNPLASNTANLAGGSGDINLFIEGAEPFDSFSLILTLIKEGGAGGGYANVYAQYNDNFFGLAKQPA
jgi:hypothetical protein